MKKIQVRLTFTEEALGTLPSNPNIYRDFIASKAPELAKAEEEVQQSEDTAEATKESDKDDKGLTIFLHPDGGLDSQPCYYDYQIKGFFKESCAMLQKMTHADAISHFSKAIRAYKKIIDGIIFVEPRQIPIDMHGQETGLCQRPLRTSGPSGERVALAISETIPAGSTIEFTIKLYDDANLGAVIEWLDYGKDHGLSQWRNSGKGRFTWECLGIETLDDDRPKHSDIVEAELAKLKKATAKKEEGDAKKKAEKDAKKSASKSKKSSKKDEDKPEEAETPTGESGADESDGKAMTSSDAQSNGNADAGAD